MKWTYLKQAEPQAEQCHEDVAHCNHEDQHMDVVQGVGWKRMDLSFWARAWHRLGQKVPSMIWLGRKGGVHGSVGCCWLSNIVFSIRPLG